MAYLNQKDISKLAEAVAADLVDNAVPLNESISKLASSMSMNQEQIHRLCEATNNTAFNKLFQKKASDEDRIVDFDIADPKTILKGKISEIEGDVKKEAHAYTAYSALPDQMHAVRTPDMESRAKLASEGEKVRIRVNGPEGHMAIFSTHKGYWELPWGTTNKGESRRDAAARILLDKTGKKVSAMNLDYVGLESSKGTMYHTFVVDDEKLRRMKLPEGENGIRPRIEFQDKTAAFELRPESHPSREVDARTVQKVAALLKQQKIACDMAYTDSLIDLRNEFRKLYDVEPFEDFEKKAAALYGSDADEPLNFVRQLMKKPEVNYNHEVLQKHAGYVDDSSLPMQLLKTAIQSRKDSRLKQAAIARIESTERI